MSIVYNLSNILGHIWTTANPSTRTTNTLAFLTVQNLLAKLGWQTYTYLCIAKARVSQMEVAWNI